MRKLSVLGLVLLTAGCAQFGLGGKTKFHVSFSEDAMFAGEEDDGESAQFIVDVEAPAGVELKEIVAFEWQWNADGSGTLTINTDKDLNTTAQAAAIIEVTQAQAQAAASIAESAASVAGQFAPGPAHVSPDFIESLMDDPAVLDQVLGILAERGL